MINYEVGKIQQTEAWLSSQQFIQQTASFGEKEVTYYVLPQRLNNELRDFAFRMTHTDLSTGSVEGIYGVSESVPEELRPWWVLHEYLEFHEIGIHTEGRCKVAETRILTVIPKELRFSYIARRIEFFHNLLGYFKTQPEGFTPEDTEEAIATLEMLKFTAKNEIVTGLRQHNLARQLSEIPITCTATSLINAVIMKGVEISQEEADELIQRVVEKRTPLTSDEERVFLARYGYTLRPAWAPEDQEIVSFLKAISAISQYMEAHSPVVFKLSTLLSKRDRSIVPIVNVNSSLPKTHWVVGVAREGIVTVIDPYEPYEPEVFFLADIKDKRRFLAWVWSVHFQTTGAEGVEFAEELIQKAEESIGNENTFPMVAMYGMMQSSIQIME